VPIVVKLEGELHDPPHYKAFSHHGLEVRMSADATCKVFLASPQERADA